MKKTILVTGAEGQLGKSLQAIVHNYNDLYHFIFTDVDTLDITDREAVRSEVRENHVDIIINAAGYTAVDKAEQEEAKAFLLNETAVANLAAVAVEFHAFLIHISTDYIFDGQSHTPYTVESKPNPISAYGRSKWAGEVAIHQSGCRAAIVRTTWLYSPYGKNFVKTMLKLADSNPEIRVVNDQIGAPTLAGDLALALMAIVNHQENISTIETYHFANKGVTSWYDFAVEIMKLADKNCKVLPISTDKYPTAATRPAYSVFDLSKIESAFHLHIPDWQISLKQIMRDIIYHYSNNIL